MTLEEEFSRGAEAQRIISDPIFREVIEGIKAREISRFTDSSPGDSGSREEAYQMLKAVEAVEGELHSLVTTGEMARRQIDEARKR